MTARSKEEQRLLVGARPVMTATRVREVTPTIDTAAYAAGDLIGGKLEFTDAVKDAERAGALVQSAVLTDLAKQDVEIDLVLFGEDPTGTTFTDNAAFDVADADLPKIVGVVTFSSYKDFNDNSVAAVASAGTAIEIASGTSLYGALVSRGAPTYASTSDLTVRVALLQD